MNPFNQNAKSGRVDPKSMLPRPFVFNGVGLLHCKHAGSDQRYHDVRRADNLNSGVFQSRLSKSATERPIIVDRNGITAIHCNSEC